MGLANYRIFGVPGEWRVEHDGMAENTFATKEAAFEAAIAAASLALRQGHEVIVMAPGSDGANATTGSQTDPMKIAHPQESAQSKTRKEIYHSENGDRWFLCHGANAHAYIEHNANLSSGGKITMIELGDFLGKGRAGPEHQALIRLIGGLVEKTS